MALYELHDRDVPGGAVVVVAFDTWVDAGLAATTAAEHLAAEGPIVATFDADALFDYRARRPSLEIVDGRPSRLTWPSLTIRLTQLGGRDLLVFTGPEPDYRWGELTAAVVDLLRRLRVREWISLGAIPAAVPHTRPVPILGTESRPGLLRGGAEVGPQGILRVPAAAISVLEHAVATAGIPALGYFAQVPHYVSGPYPAAAVALLRAVGRHLDAEPPIGDLDDEARALRTRLDTAAAVDDATRTYIERLEAMVDEARLPSGEDLISEIERFLRERGNGGGARG